MQKIWNFFSDVETRDIFEITYEIVEDYKNDNSKNFSIYMLDENLINFEKNFNQFKARNGKSANLIVYEYIKNGFFTFVYIFKFLGFKNNTTYWSFLKFIQFSLFLLKNSNGINNRSFFYRNITQNFPALNDKTYLNRINDYNTIDRNIDEKLVSFILERMEYKIALDFGYSEADFLSNNYNKKVTKEFKAFIANYSVVNLLWDNFKSGFQIGKVSYEMEISIKISDKNDDASKLIKTLFLLVNSFANIENVNVKFEILEVGSLVAKFRLFMKNLLAKEEVKGILETTKEGVVKALTMGQVSHSDTKTNSATTSKILKEIDVLDYDLKSKPSKTQAKLMNDLSIERIELENNQLRIKNAKAQLEFIEKLSDLAQKGILESDEIQINVNGHLYLLKNDNLTVEISEKSIDDIS